MVVIGSSAAAAVLSTCSGKTAGDAALAGITRAGTLLKQCPSGGPTADASDDVEWTSLFFVLNGHSLTYYPPGQRRNGLTTPSGDILLTTSTKIAEANPSVLRVNTGFEIIFLRAKDEDDATEWKRAIEATVDRVSDLPRGYFTKLHKRRRRRKKRLFFMLHQECITQHDSHAETSVISSMLPLLDTTTASTFGSTGIVVLTGTKKWKLIADTKREQDRWMNAILQVITSKQVMSSLPLVPSGFPNADLDGFLSMRQPGGVWVEHFFVLTKDALHRIQQAKTTHKASSKHFVLTPNTLVSSTNLNAFSFEIVTFSDVLHLNASCKDSKDQWIATIRGLVASIKTYPKGSKLQEASLSRDCTYYNVQFKSTNSPGLIMERRGDIALVSRVTRSLQHCVPTGSVLISVNSEPVISQPYEYVVNTLASWQPPLVLRFLAPPKKKGWLQVLVHPSPYASHHKKKSPRSRMKLLNNEPWWEQVFVELLGGKLIIHNGGSDTTSSTSDNDILPLRGSAVSLVDPKDARRRFHCFCLMSGLESITLQASSQNQMMDWATLLVHGISIENGGGFLLDNDKIHEETLMMATEDMRSNSFMDDLRSDAQSVSSPYPMQCPRPTTRPTKEKPERSPQPGVSTLPAVVQPAVYPPSLHDRTDASTATSGVDSSSRGGCSSSDNTSSYPSRPSDEANSQSKSSLLNHQYFQPSDAICSFENDDEYEPMKLLSSGDTTLHNTTSDDLSYSSEDDDDNDSFTAYSKILGDDPFATTGSFPATENSETNVAGKRSAKRPMVDSDGFLVTPDDANTYVNREVRSESPASKTFASRSSTFNYPYESESSVDEWVDVTRLTNEELGQIYDSCRDGDGVSPLSFSKLMRYVGGGSNSKGNPYAEMSLFAQFSADGNGGRGVLSKWEFVQGVRRIEEEDGIESSLYQRLIQHVRD